MKNIVKDVLSFLLSILLLPILIQIVLLLILIIIFRDPQITKVELISDCIIMLSMALSGMWWAKRKKIDLSFLKKKVTFSVIRAKECFAYMGIEHALSFAISFLLGLFMFVESNVDVSKSDFIIGNIILIGIIGPIVEEVLFRGILLQRLSQYGVKKAVIIVSLIFSVMHFLPYVVIMTFISSFFWCLFYLKYKDIQSSIFLHIAGNLFATIFSYLELYISFPFFDAITLLLMGYSFYYLLRHGKQVIPEFKALWKNCDKDLID